MAEWTTKKLADIVELRRGFDLPTRLRKPGPFPVLSAGVTAGWHSEGPIEGPGFVVGRATNLGVPTWSAGDFWPLNTTLYAADFKGNHPRFLYHLFENIELAGFDSGSVQPMLNRNYIAGVEVRIPSLTTQQAIVEVLWALDDKIAANDRIVDNVKDLLTANFADLQQSGGSDLVPISELVEFNPKVPKPHSEAPAYLDMKNLPDHAMTVTSWGHRAPRGGARFQNGDTLLARITPCLENGKTGYVDFLADNEVAIGSTEFIVLRPRNGIPAVLPYFLATDPTFREFAIRRMVGTSGRQRLSASDIASFQIRRPSEGELARLSELSDALMGRVKAAVDESRALAATRDEILPLLMSGKIRVREAEKVVEGVV